MRMINLLSTYSIGEIIIFLVIIAIAIKELITLIDWFKELIKKHFNKENTPLSLFQELDKKNKKQDEKIEEIITLQKDFQSSIQTIVSQLQILMDSDKDAIKAFITKEHHYFCYEKGWIDDYNLDCLEKRFNHYQAENGNSFVEALMEEVRALPRQPHNS